MKAIEPSLVKDNFIEIIGKEWMLVSAGDKDKFNMMTASWGGVGFLWNKPVVFVFIRPERYTREFVDAKGAFTLSFLGEEQHEVGLFFLEFLHGLAAVGGDADVEALFVEIHLNEVGNIIVVLHDKNIACHAGFLLHTSVCLSSVLLFIIRKTVRVS